jgi:hypothetical protein
VTPHDINHGQPPESEAAPRPPEGERRAHEIIRSVVLTARLLQVHFSFHRAGAALLTRVPREELGGQPIKVAQVEEHDCRTFNDLAEAVAFTRATIEAGDAIGIGWNPNEMDAFRGLSEFAGLLVEADQYVTTFGPSGAATSLLTRDNLPHAAAIIGTALLLGLPMVIEGVER